MEQAKIDRINELARKARTEGLTPEETEERAILRAEYVAAVTGSLKSHLDNTYFVDPDGSQHKLEKKAPKKS